MPISQRHGGIADSSIFYYISTEERERERGYDTKHAFQSAGNIRRGTLRYKSSPCNIREGILAGVFRISRNRMRDETSTKDFRSERSPPSSPAPCVAKVAEKRSGDASERDPALATKRARDRKRALQVVIIRGPGADSHVVRSRRTALSFPPPPRPPGVKLNFGYAGCAKCLSRAMRRFLIVRARTFGRTRQFSATSGQERSLILWNDAVKDAMQVSHYMNIEYLKNIFCSFFILMSIYQW